MYGRKLVIFFFQLTLQFAFTTDGMASFFIFIHDTSNPTVDSGISFELSVVDPEYTNLLCVRSGIYRSDGMS